MKVMLAIAKLRPGLGRMAQHAVASSLQPRLSIPGMSVLALTEYHALSAVYLFSFLSMSTVQPSYWCVANIGDTNPYEHGGAFVLVDQRNVYSPVLMLLPADETVSERRLWGVELDRLTVIKSDKPIPDSSIGCFASDWAGLSDNKFHADHPVWFGTRENLSDVASYVGRPVTALMESLLSNCPIERALGYQAVVNFHGYENFDNDPRVLTEEKARLLCDRFLDQIHQSKDWHVGFF